MKRRKTKKKSQPFLLVVALIISLFIWIGQQLVTPRFPTNENPVQIYSNQAGDDLRLTLGKAIESAEKSVLLIVFTLTDDSIISHLRAKADQGLSVAVICDKCNPSYIKKKLGHKVNFLKKEGSGLMHLKILVVDDTLVWIGSANMTHDSLRSHGNLVAGYYSPELAKTIHLYAKKYDDENEVPYPSRTQFKLGNQDHRLTILPEEGEKTLDSIQKMIKSAKKTLKVAMYTWTRFDLAESVIDAKKRGVNVEVVIDRGTSQGASQKVAQLFKKKKVPVRVNTSRGLLHHKLMIIDDKTLVFGSANWTKAAFTQNADCVCILDPLNEDQRQIIEKMWRVIMMDSKPF